MLLQPVGEETLINSFRLTWRGVQCWFSTYIIRCMLKQLGFNGKSAEEFTMFQCVCKLLLQAGQVKLGSLISSSADPLLCILLANPI